MPGEYVRNPPAFGPVWATFVAESQENLHAIEAGLLRLETSPEDADAIDAVFRGFHTLKGNTRSFELQEIAEFTHVLEELLQRFRGGRLKVRGGHITMLLQATDVLRELLAEATDGPAAAAADDGRPKMSAALGQGSSALRIDIARLDHVLDVVGETLIAQARVAELVHALAPSQHVRDALHTLARNCSHLHEGFMQLRLVPVSKLLSSFNRVLRDVAIACGRQARLEVEGNVDLDATLVEALRDPLMHMVRNAIDHGLEDPQARAAAGKDPAGVVRLRARREGGFALLEVSDDGRGLDREKILAKAREKLISIDEDAPDAEIFELIFAAGFSTAAAVTDISGRGVGLDVVRKAIDEIRGSIQIKSRLGSGTTFIVRVPLTLAIINGFYVSVNDRNFVFPAEQIVECLELQSGSFPASQRSGLIQVHGRSLPCLRLRHVLHIEGPIARRENIVVVTIGEERLGLVVDKLLGERPTVVKALGNYLRSIRALSGSTIGADGGVALILDAQGLMETADVHLTPGSAQAV